MKCDVYAGMCSSYKEGYKTDVEGVEPVINCRRYANGIKVSMCEHKKLIERLAKSRKKGRNSLAIQWDQEVLRYNRAR